MALAPRRLVAPLAVAAVLTAIGGAVAPAAPAWAADPIAAQAAPALTGPASDTTTPVKDVVLQWNKVAYATSYQVQISPNGDWTNNTVALPASGSTVATRYEVPLSLPHDEYYWRVRAVDTHGHTPWSAARQFMHDWAVPLTILHAPTSSDPSIAWAPVPEASLYRVRVSDDPGFDPNADTHACWTAATSFTPYHLETTTENLPAGACFGADDLTDGTTYFYEVVAYDDSAAALITSDNQNDPSFECAQSQPECDALSVGPVGTFTYAAPLAGTPGGGAITGQQATWHAAALPGTSCDATAECPTTPTLSWDPVVGANYYRVFVFRDPYGSNVYRAYDTEWPSVTPRDAFLDAQAGRAYYWTVAAYTCANSDTDLSCSADATKSFVSQGSVASFAKRSSAPTLQSPASGATVHSATTTFSWDDFLANGGSGAVEARNYHVQIAASKTFDAPVKDVSTVDMTSWTDPAAALPDGVYYWRVQPIDESGNGLTWSATHSFTVDAAPPVFRITSHGGAAVTHALHVAASEPDLKGPVSTKTIRVFAVTSNKTVDGHWTRNSATTWTFDPAKALVPGESYAIDVKGGLTDQAGNAAEATSHTVRTDTFVDDRSAAVSYAGSWSSHSASNAMLHTYSLGRSGSAQVTVAGRQVSVYGCKGPALGTAKVTVDGVSQAVVHEHQSFTQCGVLLWHGPLSTTSTHSLRLIRSSGKVSLDAVRVS